MQRGLCATEDRAESEHAGEQPVRCPDGGHRDARDATRQEARDHRPVEGRRGQEPAEQEDGRAQRFDIVPPIEARGAGIHHAGSADPDGVDRSVMRARPIRPMMASATTKVSRTITAIRMNGASRLSANSWPATIEATMNARVPEAPKMPWVVDERPAGVPLATIENSAGAMSAQPRPSARTIAAMIGRSRTTT